ncbi:hypothetical protein GCM10007938_13020 [Vibrio zhanjiangensis]|uniref:Uncharacterized protein n=2 Tax=Vibrio zhanjiangensis TaxID=1046128 RepID=A0ABQ6EYC8_9VIBR|nr:hypothetical protein GCM10007938_13020 [Vibrio zhanjiangensis]
MYSKYGTYYIDGIAEGVKYDSWLSDDQIKEYSSMGLIYYLKEFPYSLIHMFSHVFNSLNYDFLYTYVNEKRYYIISWYQIMSSVVTVLGFSYVYALVRGYMEYKFRSFEYFILVILISFLGVNALVAVETRFGMVPHIILTIFSILLFYDRKLVSRFLNYRLVTLILVLYSLFAMYLSYFFVNGLGDVEILLF